MPPADRIEELKKKFDENPRRYFAPLANEYRKAGDLAQAISICRTHLPQQPGHMSGHIVYGQALFENGELDEARTVFQTALELDPENLIALRHLGDIALRAGDSATARSWYERVLETDPRNEEITAVLQGLAPAAPAVAEPAPPPPIQAPSPLDDMASELAAADDPQAIDLDAPAAQPLELLDLSTDLPASSPVAPPPPAAPAPAAGTGDGDGHELLELDTSMFGQAAGRSAGADHPPLDITATALHTDEQETESAAGDASLLEGLEPTHFEGPSAEVPPPSLAGLEPQAFEPPPPEVHPARISQAFPALEEFAGLSHDGAPADSTPMQDPPAPPPPALDELPFIDTAADAPAEAPAGVAAEDFADMPAESPAESPAAAAPSVESFPEFEPLAEAREPEAREPEAAAPVVDEASPGRPTPSAGGAFVTETMAELYIQQGFHDRAADVYRQLLGQRPNDAGLRERLEAVEARMAAASAPTPAMATVAVEEGPSIREFLGRLAARRPRGTVPYVPTPPEPQAALPDVDTEGAEPPMEMGTSQVEPEQAEDEAEPASAELPFLEPYDEEPAAAEAPEASGAPEVAEEPAVAAAPSEVPTSMATPAPGSISAIFGGSVSDDDEVRASRLAAAYAPAPAHEAPPAAPQPSAASIGVSDAPAAPALPPMDAADEEPAVLPAAGRPARPAETELSLDRVFREPRPAAGARNSTGFSFDQFFSKTEGAAPAAPAPRAPEHGEAPAAGADDIAQFNAWLQGLKNK
ncbi:MAG TPA: tetratricopeptide repeat protein [Gemmatimonadaceae bacterium]